MNMKQHNQVARGMMSKVTEVRRKMPTGVASTLWLIGVVGDISGVVSWTASTVGKFIVSM